MIDNPTLWGGDQSLVQYREFYIGSTTFNLILSDNYTSYTLHVTPAGGEPDICPDVSPEVIDWEADRIAQAYFDGKFSQ